VRVRLQNQPFRVLTILLARAGEVVSRDDLRQKLWPANTYVEFGGSLNAALKRLRAAIHPITPFLLRPFPSADIASLHRLRL